MALPSANENAFLGVIVGVAIGDALGLPVDGMTADDIRSMHGAFEGYLELQGMPEGQPTKGVISDKTEIMLSIIESMTTNEAVIDPENINARLGFVIESPTRMWMSDAVVSGIQAALDNDGLVPDSFASTPEASLLVRGIPVGLRHSIGEPDTRALLEDARLAAGLTHSDEDSVQLLAQVAEATAIAARHVDRDPDWKNHLTLRSGHPLSERISAVVDGVFAAETFEEAVLPVVRQGGDASALGAVAGGIAGARFGAAGLPQQFIDDLDARIYLSMAAPWFYRTILRQQGIVVDLHMADQFPG